MFIFILDMNKILQRRSIIGLIIAVGITMLAGYAFWLQREIIRDDIYFLGRNMRGFSPQEVEELLVAGFAQWRHDPVDAVYDPERQTIVPELWGYSVNIVETAQEILQASSGETVYPVLDPLYPEIVMDDYPAAFIERGNPQKNKVALMINVAWGTEYLRPMLDVLDAENAGGTFFVVGRWAQEHGNLLREIWTRGHELANHGHTDALVYTKLTPEEMEKGLREVNTLIEQLTGSTPEYFTPHKGEYSQLLLEVVSRVGMRTVLWTLDTVDWKKPGVEKMKSKVMANIGGGAIILMHPTADTVVFLQETLPLIRQKGYAVVTLSELLSPHYPPSLILPSDER